MVTFVSGDDIIKYRARRSMSITDLSSMLGYSPQYIEAIESGDEQVTGDLNSALILAGVIPDDPSPLPQASLPAPVEQPVERALRRISNSEIQTFKRCRRKWWLAWLRGLQPRTEEPVGVRQVGNRIHRALEVMYAPEGPYPNRLLPALEWEIAEDRILAAGMDTETEKQFIKEANLERVMLEGYLEWIEQTGVDSNLEVISAEEGVVAELPNGTFDRAVALIGRIDVRVRRLSDGVRLFIDHKTVASIGSVLKLLPINEQMRHYQLLEWLLAQEGERVEGALFNMMRRVKRTPKATPPFYERTEVRFNRTAMENFYDRVVGEIKTLLKVEDQLITGTHHQSVAYPSPMDRCAWDCEFVKVCSMFDDGSRVDDALSAQFQVGDPLAYYAKKENGGESTE